MSYFTPYVDESGYHYPTYNEILEQLVEDMQKIYGSGIYLGSDSQDYEFLAKISEKIYDAYQTCEIAYNAHSPVTALGSCLDYIVAINGIARKQGTKSTATVTLAGMPGTVVEKGVVADANGYMWDLQGTAVIDGNGTVDVDAVCRENGIVQAAAGSITRIMTPTLGWDSVINDMDASTGTVTETDSELRARQAQSVAQPSQSMIIGLKGALTALRDVARCEVYENDGNVANAEGIPGHSICAVIEGGKEDEIARTILYRKGCGCGTYGRTTQNITDSDGQPYAIRFSRPTYVDIDIEIEISRRAGYVVSTPDDITGAIVSYLDTFTIGTDLTTSIIWMVAQQVNVDPRTPTFAITAVRAARHGQALGVEDIVIGFDEVARGNAANVVIRVS